MSQRRLVVGLDYGTDASGINYVMTDASSLEDINFIRDWPGAPDNGGHWKTPTRIAYAAEGEGFAETRWGFQVEPRIASPFWTKLWLSVVDTPDALVFSLRNTMEAGQARILDDKSPRAVAADFLRKLYKHMELKLVEQFGRQIFDSTPIDYWLAVPAMWSDQARNAMRATAREAGFGARSGDTVSMIDEPEAAAMAVLQTTSRSDLLDGPRVGENLLVCNCGGGLVETRSYTVAQLEPFPVFDELCVGIGDRCGSIFIDQRLRSLMMARFGPAWDNVELREKGPGSEFMNAWESVKRQFGDQGDDFVYEVGPLIMEGVHDSARYDTHTGMVQLTQDDVRSFFEPTIAKIIGLVAEQNRMVSMEGKHLDRVVLVGGFAESSFLYARLKNWAESEGEIRISRSEHPQTGTLRGMAVRGLIGIAPKQKKCPRHYGVLVSKPFREGIDWEPYSTFDPDEGVKMALSRVEWLIEKGAQITRQTSRSHLLSIRQNVGDLGRSVRELLVSCVSEEAPDRLSGSTMQYIEVVGEIAVNVGEVGIPNDSVPIKVDRHGQRYYERECELEVHFGAISGCLEVSAQIDGTPAAGVQLVYQTEAVPPRAETQNTAKSSGGDSKSVTLEPRLLTPTGTSTDGASKSALAAALDSRDLAQVMDVLERQFASLAAGPMPWLTELTDLGYSRLEIGEVLLEELEDSPWIYLEPLMVPKKYPSDRFHIQGCVHMGRGREDLTFATQHSEPSADGQQIRRAIASICGLAGIIPDKQYKGRLNGQVHFPDCCTANISFSDGGDAESIVLGRISDAVSGTCAALAYLQETRVLCNGFTILRRIPHRAVVELHAIGMKEMEDFHKTLQAARLDDDRSMEACADSARSILASVSMLGDNGTGSGIEMTTDQERLHICALAAQLLSLGLLLFCQAHMSPLAPLFLDTQLTSINLLGLSRRPEERSCIQVKSQRLTCLDAAFQSRIFAFLASDAQRIPAERCDLISKAVMLIYTWGPGAFVQRTAPLDDRHDPISDVLLRGGRIYQVSPGLYHWTQLEETQHKDILPRGQGEVWSRYANMQIGTPLDINKGCVQTVAQCLTKCQGFADPLGTRASAWMQRTREAGFQGGYYGVVTFNVGFDKDEGRTLKSQYLQWLQQGTELLAFLDAACGLQVSFCSGLARRIQMRLLLAELMPVHVQRKPHEPTLWSRLRDHHSLVEVLTTGDLEALIRKMAYDCYELLTTLIREIMLILSETGVRSSGDSFSIALVPNSATEQVRRIDIDCRDSNYWARALRDTASCATFAYFTPSCLQLNGRGCRNTEQSWHRQVPLLQTEVHRHFGGHGTSGIPSSWEVQHGELYRLGRPDADVSHALCARVLRPTPSEDPRLVVQPSIVPANIIRRLMSRAVRHQHLQERLNPSDQVVRAFMTSTEGSKLWAPST